MVENHRVDSRSFAAATDILAVHLDRFDRLDVDTSDEVDSEDVVRLPALLADFAARNRLSELLSLQRNSLSESKHSCRCTVHRRDERYSPSPII